MENERKFSPDSLFNINNNSNISFPISFVYDLSKAISLQEVLDVIAKWVFLLFSAERASITIYESETSLKIYSITGNQAIPLDFLVPIHSSFVGRVFSSSTLAICDDLSLSEDIDCKLLHQYGMGCCMDAPMIQGNECIGTLNVAHRSKMYYSQEHAVILQCLANWLALNIKLHIQINEMRALASTDFLTGASNRRIFITEGEHKVSTKALFTIGILDLDSFKILNDTYGHDAGDLVLKSIVTTVKNSIRDSDVFARIGGEEFAIIINDYNYDEVINFFEKIRTSIEGAIIPYNDKILFVTTSIGVSTSRLDDNNFSTIFKRADNALYLAKRNGRNRVEHI